MEHKIAAAFVLALAMLLAGCGSSSRSMKNSDPAAGISGNWQMSLQKSNSTLAPKTQSGSLVQNGNLVTGSVIFTNLPCSGVANVSGTVNGSTVSLEVAPVGTTINLSGAVETGSGQPSMSGSYTIFSTGCVGSQTAPQSGTFIGNMVSPLNGSIAGTFASKPYHTTYSLTGQVTQGANTGASSTPLSGSLTFTGFCYATANIVGLISGDSVVMTLVDASGARIGQVTGTIALDATALNGSYEIAGLGQGASKDCVDGSMGTVTLAIAGK